MTRAVRVALALGAVLAAGTPARALMLTSPAVLPQSPIPPVHTCEGNDVSPALTFTGVPDGTKSLVLIVDDPDATGGWTHWLVYDIPPTATSLPEGVQPKQLPKGARVALNGWNRRSYNGPCPPSGRHRYVFRLYAVDTTFGDLGDAATRADVEAHMRGHVLQAAELTGLYGKAATASR
ncbi:MAG: YbhB/YbcL family Raf kinase inhibitor-like protein [bacterium]|nr:YbhB/YbcL family Raf kinase inhibitor-like protein [bacterium]